jgi:hypothetical protein
LVCCTKDKSANPGNHCSYVWLDALIANPNCKFVHMYTCTWKWTCKWIYSEL